MGLGKFENLILTAREDHNIDSPNHNDKGPKVHFDLSGYDILWWEPNKLEEFKQALERKIRFRLTKLPTTTPVKAVDLDEKWFSVNRDTAITNFSNRVKGNIPGYVEVRLALLNSTLDVPSDRLLQIADKAHRTKHGWGIGMVNFGSYRAKPVKDGIFVNLDPDGISKYDFWALRRDGSFYLLRNLYEDEVSTGHVFFDSRIEEITEILLYTNRLYSAFKMPITSEIKIRITHGGLKDRKMRFSPSGRHPVLGNSTCTEDEIPVETTASHDRIESDLGSFVEFFSKELFNMFDFFQVDRKIVDGIISDFRKQIQA